MSRFWHEFWPQVIAVSFAVGVAGNLAASLLWAVPALWRLHRKLDQQHRERMDQAERHHRGLADRITAAAGTARLPPGRDPGYQEHGEEGS